MMNDDTVREAIETTMAVHSIAWTVTEWTVKGEGGAWKKQPIILIEDEQPFFAAHPAAYIAKLEEMHADQQLTRGSFHTLIGQFKDALDNTDWGAWNG